MADDRSLEQHPKDLSEPEAHHENRDVNVGARIEVAIGLILLTAVSIFVLVGLFPHFEIRAYANQAPSSGTNIDARILPPEPRLQDNAVQDLQQLRASEDRTLSSYGWVDRKKGVVRIHIERAIDLLAQRWLPGRPARGKLNTAGIVSSPVEAGLGPEVH